MSEKMTCPACEAHLSSILRAFEEGRPCPECGLPSSAAVAVSRARRHHIEEAILERLVTAETQLAQALAENQRLAENIEAAKAALA